MCYCVWDDDPGTVMSTREKADEAAITRQRLEERVRVCERWSCVERL